MKKKHHDLGSAKHGTGHWWHQRVTAAALVLLSFYLMSTFFSQVVLGNGYPDAIEWLHSPFSATFVILFIAAAFYHAALGLQVVIEDYIHAEGLKVVSIVAVQLVCATFGILGVLSVLKILFWSLMPHG